MRSPQAVSKLPRSKARFTLLFLALLGTEAAMELPAEAAPRSAAPSPGVLALQRQDYATAQRLLEEEYLRTHDAELLLKLGDAALGLGQKWLAASLYLNHQRQSEDPSQASPQRLAALHSATEQSAIRIFVVYQTLSQARLTLRIGGRVVGSLPLDGWIVVPPGKVVMAIEGGGAVHSFQPEELRPGQAPRTIVLTDFGPPIVSTGVTVALLGSLPARTSLSPVLEAALVSGIESNLVVVLPPTDKSYLTPPRDLAETTAVVEARRRALREAICWMRS